MTAFGQDGRQGTHSRAPAAVIWRKHGWDAGEQMPLAGKTVFKVQKDRNARLWLTASVSGKGGI